MTNDMRKIAITLDQETLDLLDRIEGSSPTRFPDRSAVVRAAIRSYAQERERLAIRENRRMLEKQLRAMVRESAKP
jgi:metal-responsive CopG/Arc/MetJ family transcriptional regulator